MKTAIIGGGAAGFFLAINLKEICPKMDITIFEKSHKILLKLEVSGGGRCNCTNTFEYITDLSQCYPRGFRLMKNLFRIFSPKDTYKWFNNHGINLKTEDNGRVFPITDNSHTIINMFVNFAKKYNIIIKTNHVINSAEELKGFDFIAITTGGCINNSQLFEDNNTSFINIIGNNNFVKPVPSLFGFKTDNKDLTSLSGLTINNVSLSIAKTKLKSTGSMLITHQGISGPCVLKLSSYGARWLNEQNYKITLIINWINLQDEIARREIKKIFNLNSNKKLENVSIFSLPNRLWNLLLTNIMPNRKSIHCKDITEKEINRLINILCNYELNICNRATNKEEFVTCGGVNLKAINQNTMQLKNQKNIFFAGEVLDIDGITGGFNFQAAWTTAFVAAQGIKHKSEINF